VAPLFARIDSLKRMVPLTILVSVLASEYGIIPVLEMIRDVKIAPIGLLAGTAVEMLVPIRGGIGISILLWLCCGLCTGALTRRRIHHDFALPKQKSSA
jgi:hypothetical protein